MAITSRALRAPSLLLATALALGALLPAGNAEAQYFGKNQVKYEDFQFRVIETDNFGIYYYREEEDAAVIGARMAERWYARISRMLEHDLGEKQPLILYANHPHFTQTTAVPGRVGEGTQGVTEPLQRRIVLPMAGPLAETDHVIGHELVHAFQYDLTGINPQAPLFGAPTIAGLPLWVIEGMAEYLSVGPRSVLTSMWIRDELRRDRPLPTVSDLANARKYFPYRYGHALWAYIGGRWGDGVVRDIFRRTVQAGSLRAAIQSVLGIPVDTLSADWHASIRETYGPLVDRLGRPADVADSLITGSGAGSDMNVGPALSPDGERMLFLSAKGLFSVELYLANARTGEIIRQVTETSVDPHFQSLQFINSAGAWAPDGRRFVFAAVKSGQPVLTVRDADAGERIREYRFPELGTVFNPSWSPDGERIVFSANESGFMDLFVLEVQSGEVRRLTEDPYADVHPAWSPSGDRIAFVSDRFDSDLSNVRIGNYRLASIDPSGGEVRALPSFPDAKNINPKWSPDGESLYFVSDATGISNLYRVELSSGEVEQLTDVLAGVSGISELSPSLAVASESGRIVFGARMKGAFDLYRMEPRPPAVEPRAGEPAGADPALLPPRERVSRVAQLIGNPTLGLPSPATFRAHSYDASLNLDYIAQPSFGVGVSSFGSFIGGGAALHFSDLLGYHTLSTQLQLGIVGGNVLNGIGAIGQYLNRENRVYWGFVGGQSPVLTRGLRQGLVDADGDGQAEFVREEVRFWQTTRPVQGLVQIPFSTAQRLELSAGFRQTAYDLEIRRETFSRATQRRLSDETFEAPACAGADSLTFRRDFCEPGTLNEAVGSAALVYDNSILGPTGPVLGQRYRFEVAPSVGTLTYVSALGDFRKYVMPFSPVTLAGRAMHFGRYGNGSDDERLGRLFVGYPSLVRGYDTGSFDVGRCPPDQSLQECSEAEIFDELIGTRLAVANVEARLPLLGPLGLLARGTVAPPLDLVVFYDAGVAWTSAAEPTFLDGSREIVTSAGVGLRVNLFGFAIGEVDYVKPFDRPDRGAFFTFHLTPAF